MKTVYVTERDYQIYLEYELDEPMYYDSPSQLYDYEGNVPFREYYLIEYCKN